MEELPVEVVCGHGWALGAPPALLLPEESSRQRGTGV